MEKVVSRIAAKRVINRASQLCKVYAGALLRVFMSMNALDITCKHEFGKGLYSVHTELYLMGQLIIMKRA